jgi:hypothetical protein
MVTDYNNAKQAKARHIAKCVNSQVIYSRSQSTDTNTNIFIRYPNGTEIDIDKNTLSTSTLTEIFSKYSYSS